MNNLSTHDFYYDLPKELIAQTPLEKRDTSRLMTLDRKTGALENKHFYDIIDYLRSGDVLVINDSKVIPARIYGKKINCESNEPDGANVEFVLLKQVALDVWEVIVRPGKRLHKGARVSFSDILQAQIEEVKDDGNRIVRFIYDKTKSENIFSILDKIGNMPLPPYITEKLEDKDRYQTVYAKENGSAAAPTAGLHFTKELLCKIKEKGVIIAPVMLHVGLGTFRPVKVDNVLEHKMHSEYFSVSEESAKIINDAKAEGRRVICVGTTSCRTVESAADDNGKIVAQSANTSIFIYPGYKFKIMDALVTNFHLPESTLLMLVSAFSSREIIMNAYKTAIAEKYRFFSFGDAMLIK